MNEQRDGMTESVDCQPAETYRFKPILPEDSVLTLEEYLAMQRTIGHSIAFRLLRCRSRHRAATSRQSRDRDVLLADCNRKEDSRTRCRRTHTS